MPLGTGSRRCSAGTRWGLSGSPETGCCTGTWRSGRFPWRRCRGMRNSSHRTSGCSGTPVRWPGSTIPTSPSSRHRRHDGGAPDGVCTPHRFPTFAQRTCRTRPPAAAGGRSRFPGLGLFGGGARVGVLCGDIRPAPSCSAWNRAMPPASHGHRGRQAAAPVRWPVAAYWPPSGPAARRSLPPRTRGRWAPPTRRWGAAAVPRDGPAAVRAVVSGYPICPAARARSGR